MALSEQEQWALLRRLDDPRHLEHPPDFDWHAARAKFDELVEFLNRAFNCTSEVERNVQDASHHGRIIIPAGATASGEFITVTVSNFGEMAAPALGNADSYGAEEVDLLFDPRDRARIEGALQELGHVVVSEVLLRAEYDGNSELRSHGFAPTWWNRFFTYL